MYSLKKNLQVFTNMEQWMMMYIERLEGNAIIKNKSED